MQKILNVKKKYFTCVFTERVSFLFLSILLCSKLLKKRTRE